MIGSKRKHVETESDKPGKIKKHGGAEKNDVSKPKYPKTEKKSFDKFEKKDKKPFDKFEKKDKKPFDKFEKKDKKPFDKLAKKPFDKFKKKSGGKENTGDRPGSKPKFMTKGIPYPSKQEEGSDAPPNWTEYKKKKKELRETRRVSKITKSKTKPEAVDVIAKAKVLSETLRRKKGTVEERAAQTEELHGLLRVKGHYKQLALAHDTTRIIQWLLKFASPHIRMEVSKELMELVVPMIQSKYARNCVKRILKYGSGETRGQVLTALHGHVVKLSAHALAAPILDYAFGEIANRKQKLLLQQEFYGDIYRTSKDATVNSLADTFKASPEMKAAMLGATKANLVRVINKNVHDCGTVDIALHPLRCKEMFRESMAGEVKGTPSTIISQYGDLVHAVLLEFLKECSSDDRAELISTLSPLIAPLSNSKPGVKAAVMCVWHGSNKDKKTILKVVKEHVVSLSSHEHGHQLILALLSSVDDTVLVGKALLTTLLKEAATIAKEEWGRKVLLWLVAPLDPAYFHPHLCSWLTAGAAAGGSKKPAPQRATELLAASLPSLLEALTADPAFWLSSGALGLVTVAILKAASGEQLKLALESVARHVSRPDWTLSEEEGKEVKGVEHAGVHMCLKKLAQRDKLNIGKEPTLGEALCANLTSEVAESWITTNRGCFLLLIIFENNSEDVQKSLKTLLLPQAKLLKKQTTAGAKILLSKIKA